MSHHYRSDLPNFLVIGVPKAGTTSLHSYLSMHPEIFMSPIKEPRFFDTDTEFERGIHYYVENCFHGARERARRGEATPSYFFHSQEVIPRVKRVLGSDLRIIVIFRDPVARAWSHYLHARALCIEHLDFQSALEREQERLLESPRHWVSYASQSFYADRLKLWFAAFGKVAVLPLLTEDLRDRRGETLSRVFEFLGVAAAPLLDFSAEQNVSPSVRSSYLMKWLNRPSLLKAPVKAIVPAAMRRRMVDKLVELNLSRSPKKSSIPPDIARLLRERFRPDVCRLETLLGRDLSHWK